MILSVIIIFSLIIISFVVLFFIWEKKFPSSKLTPERIFVFIGLLFGLLFIFTTPPFQVPDEPNHFYRAYEISGLKIISKKQNNLVGDFLPQSLETTVTELMNGIAFHPGKKSNIRKNISFLSLPLNPNYKKFISFPNTAKYCPIPYIPQVIGISLGKAFNLSPLVLMYLGRIINLIVWIILVFFAIKITPIAKWLFFLMALMPMSLFQAASLSADALTNGLSFLVISLYLYYSINKNTQKIGNIHVFIIIGLSGLLSATKQVYFFIPLLFLFIPFKNFKNKTIYSIFATSLLMLILIPNIIWCFLVKNLYIPMRPNISIKDQTLYIFSNPFNYGLILLKSFYHYFSFYTSTFIGSLGWHDTPLSPLIYHSYYFLLIIVAGIDNLKNKMLDINQKNIMSLFFFLGLILILTSQYLSWTAFGHDIIEGVQGRHIIPIALLLFLLFDSSFKGLYSKINNISFLSGKSRKIITSYSTICLSYTLCVLILRYYH